MSENEAGEWEADAGVHRAESLVRGAEILGIAAEAWPKQAERFLNLLAEQPDACPDVTKAVLHQVESGGKRFRAALPLLVHRRLVRDSDDGREDAAVWAGLSLELTHAATLCHDDVMDGDTERRNAPTVWVLHGVPQAINAGDLLFFLAVQALERAPLSQAALLRALRENSATMRRLAHGQSRETSLRRKRILPTFADWTEIARFKTGALFAHAMVLGGLTADASETTLRALDALGQSLGVLFQLQDDALDLLGDKGREQGSDLWEGKPSWLIADCASRVTPPVRDRLAHLLYAERGSKRIEDIAWLRELLDREGSTRRSLAQLSALSEQLVERMRQHVPELEDEVSGLVGRIRASLSHVV